MKGRTYRFFEGEPLYPFGFGLSYAKITEEWRSETEVTVTNHSDFAADYVALCFEQEAPRSLCGIKRLHLASGEKITVKFDKYL